jgi:hypothetical protein
MLDSKQKSAAELAANTPTGTLILSLNLKHLIQNGGRKPRERYLTGTPWFRHSLEQAPCMCCDPRGLPQLLLANPASARPIPPRRHDGGRRLLPRCSGVTAGAARACARIKAGHGRATARGIRGKILPILFSNHGRTGKNAKFYFAKKSYQFEVLNEVYLQNFLHGWVVNHETNLMMLINP